MTNYALAAITISLYTNWVDARKFNPVMPDNAHLERGTLQTNTFVTREWNHKCFIVRSEAHAGPAVGERWVTNQFSPVLGTTK